MICRRAVIGTGALAALLVSLGCDDKGKAAPPGPVGPKGNSKRAQVLVIGAGAAGLAAARELRKAGKSVIVLEGRDRAGGRIWTDRSLGAPFDLGASWIHGTRGNPVSALAKQAGAKTIATRYTDVHVYDREGKQLSDRIIDAIADEWAALQKEAEAAVERADADISIGAAIKLALAGETLSSDERRALDWVLATQQVTAAEDLSGLSASFDDESFGGGDALFPGGYDQVIRLLGDGTDVRLGHKVSRVIHGPAGVKVTSDKGIFEAEQALVTVPLGVLKRRSIAFSPALSVAKRAAISKLGMGTLNKVVLLFADAFWPTDRAFLGYMSGRAGEYPVFMNCRKFSDANALMAFTGGSFARSIEGRTDAQIRDRIMQILTSMFGAKATAPTHVKVARWNRDPFARGSYSHVPVGAGGKHHDALAKPASKTLFFAGEACSRSYSGTVHGALLSGVREAERMQA